LTSARLGRLDKPAGIAHLAASSGKRHGFRAASTFKPGIPTMQMTGEYLISAPREVVWRALNDPEILRQSIPGCESLEKLSDTELTAKVSIAIGPVKARFTGKVTLSDLDPPNGYTISGEGQGGVAGFGKGKAAVKLIDKDGGTLLTYTAEAQVGGKLAQLGARLIDSTAKKLADEFFSRFALAVAPPAAAAAGMATTAPAAASGGGTRLSPAIWIPALVIVVAAILYFALRS
jgi:carbon monoxide dehydrogenase subunit G